MRNDPHVRHFSHAPLLQLATAVCLGVYLATLIQVRLACFVFGLIITTFAIVYAVLRTNLHAASLCLLLAFALAASCLTLIEARTGDNRIKRLMETGSIDTNVSAEVTGLLSGPPEFARSGLHFVLNSQTLRTDKSSFKCSGRLLVHAWFRNQNDEQHYKQLNLRSGSQLRLHTQLTRTNQYRNPGVSTLTDYLDSRDYDAMAIVHSAESIVVIAYTTNQFSGWIYEWRELLQGQIDSHFSPDTAGVLSAALLGNHYNLAPSIVERFREGGTFHVLVISGAHISFLGAIVLFIVRRLTIRRWLQLISSSSVVWIYTFAVGADASVVRAALTFSFVAIGSVLFRPASQLNSLGAAALVLLVWNPRDLFDPSFQLTFLSVLAIVGFAWPFLRGASAIGKWRPTRQTPRPPDCSVWLQRFAEMLYWSETAWRVEVQKHNHTYRLFKSPFALWLERHRLQWLLRYTFAATVVSMSVQALLLPLQIVYFHRISFSALILNVAVGVLLAILAGVALLGLLIAQFSEPAAAPLVHLADSIDWLMVHSVDPFASVGVAAARIPEYSSVACFLYYVPFILLGSVLAKWNPLTRTTSPNRIPLILTAQTAMCALLLFHPYSAERRPGNLRVDFLDVGQGDSALVTMPDGTTLLIDGGGRPDFNSDGHESQQRRIGETVVSEYLWWRGLDSVDYVLVTHADADHIDGLNDVVRNFKVRSALVGRQPPADNDYVRFEQTLRLHRTTLQCVQAGDVLRFGNVSVEVIWPPAAASTAPSHNNDSVVLRIRFGDTTLLFTGDIERGAEQALLHSPEQLRADVVKVPHHGSRTSSTNEFVSMVHARLAIISVGRTSMFGHPHREVVDRWKASGAEVLTTGEAGMITVITDGKSLSVTKFVED